MKKQILLFTIGIIGLLIFASCKNDKPTSATTNNNLSENSIGLTGIPEIDNLTREVDKNPNDPKLLVSRANAFYKNDNYDNAILDMSAAMKIDSTNADYHHILADIYLDYYKSRLALKTMKRCVSLYPERIPSLLKLAEFQQILKQNDASMGTISRIMKLEPNNPEGFFMLGVNHIDMGNKPMAIKTLKRAVDIDPEHSDAYILLGNIYEQDKDPIAEQYYKNAVSAAPGNSEVLYSQASYLHSNDRLDEARNVLKKVIEMDRNYTDAFQRMGVIYIEKDSLQKAYDNFNIAVNVDPSFGTGFYYRGFVLERMGKLEEAREDYRTVVRMDTKHQKAKEGLSRIAQALKQ